MADLTPAEQAATYCKCSAMRAVIEHQLKPATTEVSRLRQHIKDNLPGLINGFEVGDWYKIAVAKEQALDAAITENEALATQVEQLQGQLAEVRNQTLTDAAEFVRGLCTDPDHQVCAYHLAAERLLNEHADDPCPTCSPPTRRTVGMVCPDCGTDYAPDPEAE